MDTEELVGGEAAHDSSSRVATLGFDRAPGVIYRNSGNRIKAPLDDPPDNSRSDYRSRAPVRTEKAPPRTRFHTTAEFMSHDYDVPEFGNRLPKVVADDERFVFR